MPTTYDGNGNLPSAQSYARIAILSSNTAVNPTSVTTSNPHGLTTGDTVFIEGHLLNTVINGRFVANVTSTITFTVPVGGGGLVGGATGYVVSYAVAPLITIPSDGDSRNASSVNPAFQALADFKPFIYERVGKWRLYNTYSAATTDDTWTIWSTNVPGIFNTAAWATVAAGSALFSFSAPAPLLGAGDLIEIHATVTCAITGPSGILAVGLGVSTAGGAYSVITGSAQRLPTAATTFLPLNLHAYAKPSSGAAAVFDIGLMGFGNGFMGGAISFSGHRQFTVNHYRAN